MARKKSHATIQKELTKFLSPALPGIKVQVSHNDRWERVCVQFCWPGFADTLPEERFRLLLLCLPEDYRQKHLSGAVWLELAPGESVEAYLALPRSDDIASREAAIAKRLVKAKFFDALEAKIASLPVEQSMADLSNTRAVLREKGFTEKQAQDACLLCIRHGALADCDVLLEARTSILALERSS
jgi:hypothetical protein